MRSRTRFLCPLGPPVRPSVAAGRHREPNVTPNGLKKRPGDLQKSMKNPCCGLRGALGALGVSRGTPLAPKMLQNTVFPTLAEHLKEPCALCSIGTRTKKIAMVLSPTNMFSKSWRWFCPPRAPVKKLAVVLSLQKAPLVGLESKSIQ